MRSGNKEPSNWVKLTSAVLMQWAWVLIWSLGKNVLKACRVWSSLCYFFPSVCLVLYSAFDLRKKINKKRPVIELRTGSPKLHSSSRETKRFGFDLRVTRCLTFNRVPWLHTHKSSPSPQKILYNKIKGEGVGRNSKFSLPPFFSKCGKRNSPFSGLNISLLDLW